jgi:hypothetical protein
MVCKLAVRAVTCSVNRSISVASAEVESWGWLFSCSLNPRNLCSLKGRTTYNITDGNEQWTNWPESSFQVAEEIMCLLNQFQSSVFHNIQVAKGGWSRVAWCDVTLRSASGQDVIGQPQYWLFHYKSQKTFKLCERLKSVELSFFANNRPRWKLLH